MSLAAASDESPRLRVGQSLVQTTAGAADALPATGGDVQLLPQRIQAVRALFDGLPYIVVGHGVADTDVHAVALFPP